MHCCIFTKEGDLMPQTEAQRKAKQKYDAKTYKTIGIKCPIEEYNVIGSVAENNNQTASMFSRNCIRYCIDNNVDFSDNNSLSKKLFDLRNENKLTPTQVAKELDIRRDIYMSYEVGKEKPPTIVLSHICKLYNLPKNYFDTNSNLVAVGNKGYIVQNTDSSKILEVTNEEFEMLKKVLEEYRSK